MRSLVENRWFWPAVASPLAGFGIVAMAGGCAPGVVSGLGLLLGWVLSFPFGHAEASSAADPTPRSRLVVAGWGAARTPIVRRVPDRVRRAPQRTRPIYEVVFGGREIRVAVTVGDNGFIVGANPVG